MDLTNFIMDIYSYLLGLIFNMFVLIFDMFVVSFDMFLLISYQSDLNSNQFDLNLGLIIYSYSGQFASTATKASSSTSRNLLCRLQLRGGFSEPMLYALFALILIPVGLNDLGFRLPYDHCWHLDGALL